MVDDNPLYVGGFPNPGRLGFFPIRLSSGERPDTEVIARAAHIIGTPVKSVDRRGYECEIIGAAIDDASGHIAFVETRAKELGHGLVDIHIHVHLRAPNGADDSWPIKSYNPYFGCDVGFFQWFGRQAILIYREKHHTYVCKFGPAKWWSLYLLSRPTFKKISDYWMVNDHVLAYWDWEDTRVSRLTLPKLRTLDAISEEEARVQGVLPPKHW